jgi:diguanylate cyclase (GGDEF)-like protein
MEPDFVVIATTSAAVVAIAGACIFFIRERARRRSSTPLAELAHHVRTAVRSRDWSGFPGAQPAASPAAAEVVSGFRYLLGELDEREELLKQFQRGAVEQHRLLLEEMTEHERDSERLTYVAYFDALTGLPNRSLFFDRLERALNNARRFRFEVGVIAIDVDRLRRVNESLGHRIGDKVLELVATRLRQALRREDTVARWGGDEFLILLHRIGGASDGDVVARKLLAAVSQPAEIEGYDLNITATLGISLFPGDGVDGDSLVQRAAAALHHAKRNGTNRFEQYRASIAERPISSPLLENRLRRAIENEEFVLHYQPIVNLESGRLTAVEALIRWQHPQLGLLSPASFIGLAEETGMIIPITSWVLREACTQLRRWTDENVPLERISVNMSPRQLREPDLQEMLGSIVRECGVDPGRVELEVTETVLVPDDLRSAETLGVLKSLGFRIAIDDFGTGYSSLSYLQRLPIDALKIDRAFIRDLCTTENSAAIVDLIVAVGHRLGLRVTAEGVEDPAHMELLRVAGCDEVQGYLLGEPQPPSEIAWMRDIDLFYVRQNGFGTPQPV